MDLFCPSSLSSPAVRLSFSGESNVFPTRNKFLDYIRIDDIYIRRAGGVLYDIVYSTANNILYYSANILTHIITYYSTTAGVIILTIFYLLVRILLSDHTHKYVVFNKGMIDIDTLRHAPFIAAVPGVAAPVC